MSEPIGVAFVEVRPQVDDFQAQAEQELTAGLGTDAVAVRGEFQLNGIDAARSDIEALTQEARDAVTELAIQTSPDFARGFVEGAEEAVQAAVEFGDATELTTENIITAEAARRALEAANLEVAASEQILAAATRDEAQAVIEADANERQLFRTRARRAGSLGPLRLAGIGVGAGVALFTATQALRELGDQLAVTGNEATTASGKLRNVGASLLSGDVVGAFKAATNNTKEYSAAQVGAIVRSEELAAATRDLGVSLNELLPGLEASAQAAAQQLTETPQFLQTRIAQTEESGDTAGQLQALKQAREQLEEQEALIRELPLEQAQINAALEAVFNEQININGQIEALTKEARPDILGPLVEAVTDARLTGDRTKIIAALRAEASALEDVIASAKTNAADRRRFKDELAEVNADIEATQDEIVAEQQRHQQAMLDKILDVGVLEDLEAENAGGTPGAGRAARAAAIQATLDRGTLNGKKLTRDQKEQLNAELANINRAIEAEQEAIVNEEKRHVAEMQRLADQRDQNFIDSLGGAQRGGRNRAQRATATVELNDDIAASEFLQRVYRQQIALARKNIEDRKQRNATIATLEDQLAAEERSERVLRQQNRRERIDRREESLDLNIQLAQANENIAAELRAHNAKIRFLQERIRHTRAGTNQRKRLRLEIAQERAEIRRLNEELGKDNEGANFKQLAFSFLQELQGFSSNLASNVLPGNFSLTPSSGTSSSQTFRKPPVPTSPTDDPFRFTPSPFEQGKGGRRGGRDPQGDAAMSLRESGGAPATSGQLEVLINVGRTTNKLLGDIKRGVGHPEARTARELNRHRGGTVDVQ